MRPNAPVRRARRAAGAILLAALGALFALDLRHAASHAPPRLTLQQAAQAPLEAGWGQAALEVPYPVVPAGYGPRDRGEVRDAATPLQARALAFRSGGARFSLVSVDLLEVDEGLRAEVERALGDAGPLWVCATHSHTAMGNYDPSALVQVAAGGRFFAPARRALVQAIAAAVRAAQAQLAPVRLSAAREPTPAWVVHRGDGSVGVDATQGVLQLETAQGRAQLRVLGAHPTLAERPAAHLDGDYPARWVALEAAQGVFGMLLQGAGGDASVDRAALATPAAVAAALSPPADAGPPLPASGLSLAEAWVELPGPDIGAAPAGLGRAAANGFDWLGPRAATVGAVQLGPLTLLALPGELTAAARAALPADAWPVTLCNGYVGYIEAPTLVEARRGEARRSYYGPALLPALARGAEAALAPTRP
jgi:hypothetical protein